MKLAPIQSLAQLQSNANRNPNYRRLAILAAENLGHKPNDNLDEAMRLLRLESLETNEETIVEEVNYCIADV